MSEKRKKNIRVPFYISQKESEILDKHAKELKLNRSEFIRRMCCSDETELSVFKEEHIKLYNEINAIGRNLNQLTKFLNTNAYQNKKIDLKNLEEYFDAFKRDLTNWRESFGHLLKKKL